MKRIDLMAGARSNFMKQDRANYRRAMRRREAGQFVAFSFHLNWPTL